MKNYMSELGQCIVIGVFVLALVYGFGYVLDFVTGG